MHKPSLLSCLTKFFDRWFDNFEANCKIREEDLEEDPLDAIIKTDE